MVHSKGYLFFLSLPAHQNASWSNYARQTLSLANIAFLGIIFIDRALQIFGFPQKLLVSLSSRCCLDINYLSYYKDTKIQRHRVRFHTISHPIIFRLIITCGI